MDQLNPIPTPPAQLWREFRVRLVPAVLFIGAAIGVATMWRNNVAAPSFVGEVEAVQSNISSPKAGKLSQLNATRLQRVKAGDVIAQVITTDPEILQSSLAVIEAEIRLLRVNLEPVLGQQRFALTYDRLRLDWMEQRVQLVTSRVRLELAEAELRRAEELFKDKVVSQQILDTARSAKESLQVEVDERNHLVAEQERNLKTLGPTAREGSDPKQSNPEDVMQASIRVQEEKLRLTEAELRPIKLTVPMDATITAVHHRSGEAIVAGEPIVTLTALNSDRILSYVRHPLAFRPQIGMKVEIRTRSFDRCVSEAAIMEVGGQMEQITAALSSANGNRAQEIGLPILVSLPSSQKLLPGEIVDLRIIEPHANQRQAGSY
ncbi:MAG: biotin/lipoyl-binding protein [Verrucomicrobiota bacterium]